MGEGRQRVQPVDRGPRISQSPARIAPQRISGGGRPRSGLAIYNAANGAGSPAARGGGRSRASIFAATGHGDATGASIAQSASAFHDVTTGTNGTCGTIGVTPASAGTARPATHAERDRARRRRSRRWQRRSRGSGDPAAAAAAPARVARGRRAHGRLLRGRQRRRRAVRDRGGLVTAPAGAAVMVAVASYHPAMVAERRRIQRFEVIDHLGSGGMGSGTARAIRSSSATSRSRFSPTRAPPRRASSPRTRRSTCGTTGRRAPAICSAKRG